MIGSVWYFPRVTKAGSSGVVRFELKLTLVHRDSPKNSSLSYDIIVSSHVKL